MDRNKTRHTKLYHFVCLCGSPCWTRTSDTRPARRAFRVAALSGFLKRPRLVCSASLSPAQRALGSATVNSRDAAKSPRLVDSRQTEKQTKTATEMVTVLFGSPCWTRTSDTSACAKGVSRCR